MKAAPLQCVKARRSGQNSMMQDRLQAQLRRWFLRGSVPRMAVRQIDELPLAVGSDVGAARSENQDRAAVLRAQLTQNRSFYVAAICDGMGGMTEGATCAAIAMGAFLANCIHYRDRSPEQRVLLSASKANEAVHSEFRGQGGATLSAVLIDSTGVSAGVNIGDSRIYAVSPTSIKQLTKDDTLAGQVDIGTSDIGKRNELLQYIGIGEVLEPHLIPIFDEAETLLLTSDGVHYLPKEIIAKILQRSPDTFSGAKRLIDVANWMDGRDNASVIVAMPSKLAAQSHRESGTIEIWDPFGDVLIIGVTRTDATPNALASDEPAGYFASDAATDERQTPSRVRASRQTRRSKVGKKSKDTAKPTGRRKEQDPPPRPQLKIEFEDEGDDDA